MRIRAGALAMAVVIVTTAAACSSPPNDTPGVSGGATSRPAVAQGLRRGAFPGDVVPGHVRWGAAIGGNSDPVGRHEATAAVSMGLRRTYFGWDNRMKAVTMAKADLAAGRLPWVSFKTPAWAAVASGAHDAQLDELLRALDATGGPVWVTFHHEPENDGLVAAEWRAMQVKVRERMDATGVKNLAFASVLMSWTFDPRSGRNPDDWFVPGIWDFAGIDHYSESTTNTSVELPMWVNTRAYYHARGLKIAIGEWGNRGTDASAADEMAAFYDAAIGSGASGKGQIIGLAYFDSDLNSPKGGWTLYGAPLDRFRALMTASTSIGPNQVSG